LLPPPGAVWGRGLQRGGGTGLLHGATEAVAAIGREQLEVVWADWKSQLGL